MDYLAAFRAAARARGIDPATGSTDYQAVSAAGRARSLAAIQSSAWHDASTWQHPGACQSTTEMEAYRRLAAESAMQWRIRRYGCACLTVQEHRAVSLSLQFLPDKLILNPDNLSADEIRAMEWGIRKHGKGAYSRGELTCLKRSIAAPRVESADSERVTQMEIARKMGIGQQRVSQLLARAEQMIVWLDGHGHPVGWQRGGMGWTFVAPIEPTMRMATEGRNVGIAA